MVTHILSPMFCTTFIILKRGSLCIYWWRSWNHHLSTLFIWLFHRRESGLPLLLLQSYGFSLGHWVSNFWCKSQSISCFIISHYSLGSILSVLEQYILNSAVGCDISRQFCASPSYLATLKSVVRGSVIWRSQSELCCCKSVLRS